MEASVLLFTLIGKIAVGGKLIQEKTAVKLSQGDVVKIESFEQKVQVLFVSSVAIDEPIAWGGPIVMNTKEELNQAFDDLRNGTFLQSEIKY